MKRAISVFLAVLLVLSMATSAMAASPSVQINPIIKEKISGTGEGGAIVIQENFDKDDPEQKIIHTVPPEEFLLITPNRMDAEHLEGYRKLAKAKSIIDVCDNFEEVLAKMDKNAEVEDMVVRDVFELRLLGESARILEELKYNFITLKFAYNAPKDADFMILEYVDGEWFALEPEQYEIGDGTLTVSVLELGIFAFVVNSTLL